MNWWLWLHEGAIYLVIAAALLAGLAASYGRELEAKRRPDRGWWIRRLLIMPLLAIAATAATDLFRLGNSVTAFSVAICRLGDTMCFVTSRRVGGERQGLRPRLTRHAKGTEAKQRWSAICLIAN